MPTITFNLQFSIFNLICGYGEIGRRAGFRFLWVTPCGFESLYPHHERVVILIQFVLELQPFFLFFRAFLAYKRLLTGILPVKSRFGYDKYFRR